MSVIHHEPAPLPRVGVDPRIRQRRIEVRRRQGRRRLAVLTGLLVVAGLAAGAWGVLHSGLTDLDRIEVRGAARTDPARVVEASGLVRGQALVSLAPAATATAVEDLPWVATARVARDWPATVVITVTERVPAAAVLDGDGWVLVDDRGRVLERTDALPPGLVVVESATPPGAPGTTFARSPALVAVARQIPAALRPAVAAVRLGGPGEEGPGEEGPGEDGAGRGGITLGLSGGGEAWLGSADGLDAKLRAVATVLARVDTAGLAVLDVRIPESPVVTRATSTSGAPTEATP